LIVSLGKRLLSKWQDKGGRGKLEEYALNERRDVGSLGV